MWSTLNHTHSCCEIAAVWKRGLHRHLEFHSFRKEEMKTVSWGVFQIAVCTCLSFASPQNGNALGKHFAKEMLREHVYGLFQISMWLVSAHIRTVLVLGHKTRSASKAKSTANRHSATPTVPSPALPACLESGESSITSCGSCHCPSVYLSPQLIDIMYLKQ